MVESNALNGQGSSRNAVWRGVDCSGLAVVLGVGTGRLIKLLNRRVAASEGSLLVVSHDLGRLKALVPLMQEAPLALVHGRPGQIPVLSGVVDLLVVNGILRQVPEGQLEAMFDELWRALVPGGLLRVSDVIEPSHAPYNLAWAERNRIVRKLAKSLGRPTALSVDLQGAAAGLRSAGFEDLHVSILPGYGLTDNWLQKTVNALRSMTARVVDRQVRNEILEEDINRLVGAYAQGGQRGAERFVLQGTKAGDLAVTM
jgi:hypothetical protein